MMISRAFQWDDEGFGGVSRDFRLGMFHGGFQGHFKPIGTKSKGFQRYFNDIIGILGGLQGISGAFQRDSRKYQELKGV